MKAIRANHASRRVLDRYQAEKCKKDFKFLPQSQKLTVLKFDGVTMLDAVSARIPSVAKFSEIVNFKLGSLEKHKREQIGNILDLSRAEQFKKRIIRLCSAVKKKQQKKRF